MYACSLGAPELRRQDPPCMVDQLEAYLPASPCAVKFYEIWRTRSTHRPNHVCQIFSQSVQGLWSSDTPKLPFPIDLLHRSYNSVRTAM